jgi:hypothetical protein
MSEEFKEDFKERLLSHSEVIELKSNNQTKILEEIHAEYVSKRDDIVKDFNSNIVNNKFTPLDNINIAKKFAKELEDNGFKVYVREATFHNAKSNGVVEYYQDSDGIICFIPL